MAKIAVKPYVFKDAVLNVKDESDTDLGDFEAAISEGILDPNVSIIKWAGATPTSTFSDTTTPDWTFGVKWAQDYETSGSLSNILFANMGKQLTFTLTANNGAPGTPKQATFVAVAVPGNYGGTVGRVAESSATLPVIGQPEFSDAA